MESPEPNIIPPEKGLGRVSVAGFNIPPDALKKAIKWAEILTLLMWLGYFLQLFFSFRGAVGMIASLITLGIAALLSIVALLLLTASIRHRLACRIIGTVGLIVLAYYLHTKFPLSSNSPTQKLANVALFGIPVLKDSQGGFGLEFPCKNSGGFLARKTICGGAFYFAPAVSGNVGSHVQEEFYERYRKSVDDARRSGNIPPDLDLEVGQTLSGRSSIGRVEGDQLKKLQQGTEVILVLGEILFSDDAGDHKKEFCQWITPPFPAPGNITWHLCDRHNEQIY